MKLTPNDLKPLFNETQINISTQQLMDMCSGEFVTQLPQVSNYNVIFYLKFDLMCLFCVGKV